MSRRRIGIVGAGIGAEHLEGWLAHPERFEIAAICDLDEARARPLVERAVAQGSPAARPVAEIDQIMADSSIDVVDICLPPRLHCKAIVDALAHGHHVVCEKPLVASLAEWDTVKMAADISGRVVMPVFQYRFGAGIETLQKLIDEGHAGTPLVATIETHWHRGADYYDVDWRGKWATELGGAIVGHAIHNHDLLSQVLGPIATVQARLATRVNPVETEDCAAMVLTMASGALVTSSVTLGAADDRTRLRFCFSRLTAESGSSPYAPARGDWRFEARGDAEARVSRQSAIDRIVADLQDQDDGEATGFARQFALFDDALAERCTLPVTLEDARASLELITATYAANASGARIELPLQSDHPGYSDWQP